jgi:hypothetical protein
VASKFLEAITNTFQTPLPQANDLDKYLEEMLPELEGYSENLDQESLYLEHPWLEFRDDGIRLSKYIFYNFWKLLGSNSESLLTGWFPILFRVSVIHA